MILELRRKGFMKRLHCPYCDKPIRTESGMAWHQNRNHGNQMLQEDQEDSQGTFGTPPCS